MHGAKSLARSVLRTLGLLLWSTFCPACRPTQVPKVMVGCPEGETLGLPSCLLKPKELEAVKHTIWLRVEPPASSQRRGAVDVFADREDGARLASQPLRVDGRSEGIVLYGSLESVTRLVFRLTLPGSSQDEPASYSDCLVEHPQ